MGRGKGGKGKGGKGRAGRGGGGKGKGKGRKGGGKGKKRKRDADSESGGESSSEQGASQAEQGGGARLAVEAADPVAKASKPSRPGFDALLQTLGVEDSDAEGSSSCAEDDAGEEVAEEEEEEDAAPGAEGAAEEDAEEAEEAEEEEEEDEEGAEDEGEDAQARQLGKSPGGAAARPAQAAAADGTLDFYPTFWSDPPVPLAGPASAGGGGSEPAEAAAGRGAFALPGLARCEARCRDVSALLQHLQKPQDAVEAWRRCALAPGLRERFEEWLGAENLDVGAAEGAFFLFLHSYLDVAFPHHTHLNARAVRAFCVLHVVDHVVKATREVLANSAKLNSERRKGDRAMDTEDVAPDQGFTRARVLVICPFRSACHELVTTFLALLPGVKQVGNRKRFDEEFGGDDAEENDDQPPDWHHLFKGNNDDNFKVGLSVSKKAVRLCTPFDRSDVIFGSPLGLRMITGAEGERKRDFDFLSSIEVCLVDRADVLRMQNWEHVEDVLGVVNSKPQGLQGIDISRLRPAFAEGRARAFRQTVVTSAGQSIDADSLFSKSASESGTQAKLRFGAARGRGGGRGQGQAGGRFDSEDEEDEADVGLPGSLLPAASAQAAGASRSCRGLVKLCAPPDGGALQRSTALGVTRQFFLHVASGSLQEQNDRLFEAFQSRYWKPLGSTLERLMVVVNSYFNFLKLRQWLRDEGVSFCSAFEYSKNQDLSRARYRFFHGERRLLLVTERFLWYRRYRLKGADYVLFYGPPETPEIYEEVLSGVRTPSQCNSMCLFTKQDGFALQRIVGDQRAQRMLASPPGKVFAFS